MCKLRSSYTNIKYARCAFNYVRSYSTTGTAKKTSPNIYPVKSKYPSRRNTTKLATVKLHNPSDWTVQGISIAGICTSIHIQDINVMIDAGAKMNIKPDYLMITHHHCDHNRYLKHYVKSGTKLIDVVRTQHDKKFGLSSEFNLEIFNMYHTAQSVAYGISSVSGDNTKEVVICGDTKIQGLYENPGLFGYPTIIVECTNFKSDPNQIKSYNKYGHISWDELRPIVQKHTNNNFLLTHASSGLSHNEMTKLQDYISDLQIKNVKLFY